MDMIDGFANNEILDNGKLKAFTGEDNIVLSRKIYKPINTYSNVLYTHPSLGLDDNNEISVLNHIPKDTLLFVEHCIKTEFETLHNLLFFTSDLFNYLNPKDVSEEIKTRYKSITNKNLNPEDQVKSALILKKMEYNSIVLEKISKQNKKPDIALSTLFSTIRDADKINSQNVYCCQYIQKINNHDCLCFVYFAKHNLQPNDVLFISENNSNNPDLENSNEKVIKEIILKNSELVLNQEFYVYLAKNHKVYMNDKEIHTTPQFLNRMQKMGYQNEMEYIKYLYENFIGKII